ncbi:MAG: hypothetical protein JWN95_1796 [Frankiales bacterium]|nr:hypothetical protein [Frankiales bacterium]
MNLRIVGQSIERVSFDYAVTVLTDGGAEIRIETAFSLRAPSGESVVVDPSQPGRATELMTSLLHNMITGAEVNEESGTLVLDLMNGTRLEVGPSKSYEAWTFTGECGLKAVARPGGGVSTWTPDL